MQKASWEEMFDPQKRKLFRSECKKYNKKPTGRRKVTQAEQAWNQKLTGRFEATNRLEVLLTFKKAASKLGINDVVCRFIDLLCC